MTYRFDNPGEVQAAANSGDVRAMLVATRSQIARALDAASSKSTSSVAALSKQLLEVQAQIDALENTV